MFKDKWSVYDSLDDDSGRPIICIHCDSDEYSSNSVLIYPDPGTVFRCYNVRYIGLLETGSQFLKQFRVGKDYV